MSIKSEGRKAVAAAAMVVAVLGCQEDRGENVVDPAPAVDTSVTSVPVGSGAVHASIQMESDCSELQASFDRSWGHHQRHADSGNIEAMEWATAYMEAADRRMIEIGCTDG